MDWGFCDTIRKTGHLLFPSLLRYRAANQLAEMTGDQDAAGTAATIAAAIESTLYDAASGLYWSATGVGRQRDIWGSAFAVYCGAGCRHQDKTAAALLQRLQAGTIEQDGYIRPIATDENHSPHSAWESTATPFNDYQNGAYWATPTGWVWYAVSLIDPAAADALMHRFIQHTEAGAAQGTPYEYFGQRGASGRQYGTSATLPYAGVINKARVS